MNLQWKGASDPWNLTEPFFTFSQDITMLKKWFISAFPQIQKISQNLGPKLGQKLLKIESSMKRCIGSAKPHRTVFRFFERYYDAKEVIHKRISWNPENISKSGPKVRPKILKIESLMKGASDPRNLTEPFFTFSKDITMLKKWFISAFPQIQKISQNLGPNLGQKLLKIESSMKRCIGSAKPHRTVFHFFARYYDAKEVIHKRISWNPENISKSGPKLRPKIVKKLNLQWKGASDPWNLTEPFFAFSKDITMLKKWFISAFPEIENISKSGPKIRPKIVKNWIFNEKVHRIRETSQNRFSLFRKILRC